MARETELKVRIADAKELAILLQRCRAVYGQAREIVQRDEYFDTQDGDLQRADLTVRLRHENGTTYLALKSARVWLRDGVHTRLELEFEAPAGEIASQLEKQHLEIATVIEKRRKWFRAGSISVVVDELPVVGWFAEIEGSSAEEVERVLQTLDLTNAERVRENYTELLVRACGRGPRGLIVTLEPGSRR